MSVHPGTSNHSLIVSLNVTSEPANNKKNQNRRHLQVSSWKDIDPNAAVKLTSILPWIVVHTASHPSLRLEKTKTGKATRENHSFLPMTEKGPFCGWNASFSYIYLELSPDYLRQAASEMGEFPLGSFPDLNVWHTRDPKIMQISEWLIGEMGKRYDYGNLYIDTLANLLALEILRQSKSPMNPLLLTDPPSDSLEVARAIEYMQAHLSQDISLAVLSQVVHISASQLGRLFKHTTNLTPHQYLILLRVQHAGQLLSSGIRPISEVASQAGFVDQSHLNRHFKRVYGVTPRTFLNR